MEEEECKDSRRGRMCDEVEWSGVDWYGHAIERYQSMTGQA